MLPMRGHAPGDAVHDGGGVPPSSGPSPGASEAPGGPATTALGLPVLDIIRIALSLPLILMCSFIVLHILSTSRSFFESAAPPSRRASRPGRLPGNGGSGGGHIQYLCIISFPVRSILTSRNICTVPAANRVGLSRPRHADLLPFASGRQGHPAVGTCNTYHVLSVLIVDPFDR